MVISHRNSGIAMGNETKIGSSYKIYGSRGDSASPANDDCLSAGTGRSAELQLPPGISAENHPHQKLNLGLSENVGLIFPMK